MAEVILTDQNFEEEVLQSRILVMVEFWAIWCGPCTMAAPIIEELAKKYEGKTKVGKLNVDENPQAAEKYGIMSIPTVIFFKDGQEVKRQVGFPGKEGYIRLIQDIVGN